MKKNTQEIKAFSVRMPKDVWVFLRTESLRLEMSMVDIILKCVDKHRKIVEKRLTPKDTAV
jgi:hypothetical protein